MVQQHHMKIMLLISYKSREAISKVIELSIFHRNSFIHELQKSDDFDVKKIRSYDNFLDLFTKALSTITFNKLVHNPRMYQLKDLSL